MVKVGIRREDRGPFERRTPLPPQYVARLMKRHSIEFLVEPSPHRVFPDKSYAEVGATLTDNLDSCTVIVGVKEIQLSRIIPQKIYMFFSHTIKGQKKNMPMLNKMIQQRCSLIDYEKITDSQGRRLVFFGYHAGVAGMVDALWLYGRRLAYRGNDTPLKQVKRAFEYARIEETKEHISLIGSELADHWNAIKQGSLNPAVVGFAGYGNVSKGAQEVFDLLPHKEISPEEFIACPDRFLNGQKADAPFLKLVFEEKHIVEHKQDPSQFDLQEYYEQPELYAGVFGRWVPYLDMLINCIYWEPKYPRLITRELLSDLCSRGHLRLDVIADISCDVEGSIEITSRCATVDKPAYVFNPKTGRFSDNPLATGIAVLAVDILPAEIPFDASMHFGDSLERFIPALASISPTASFEELDLPPELKRAVILWQGKFAPSYEYLRKYVE